MATNKKIPSQGNLVDLLAAFGRGALGTLTDRFGQYDAALESVAAHEGQIASINQGKTSWANGGTITSETYYNILKGTQDSFTLPFDLNGFVSGITANGNAQRYSGVMYAVSYANKPGQPKQRSDTFYLPFAAVNAEKGVVAFEDLQFRYTDLQNDEVDVRYKVTPVSNSQIKLEKMEESAGSAPQEWVIPTLDNGDILGSAFGGGNYEANGFVFDESKVKVGDIVKVTDCAEATLTVIGIHAWEIYTGYKKNVYHLFLSREEKPAIVYQMCLDSQVGYFIKLFDASTYAKKTDIRYPWLEIDMQDDLYDGIANLNPGERFELAPQSTDINPNEDLSKYCGLRLHDTNDNVWYLPWAHIYDDRSEYDTCPFMFNGNTLKAEVIGGSVWFINNDPDLSDYAKKTDLPAASPVTTVLVSGDNDRVTDKNSDYFNLTPEKLKDGTVDYFAIGVPDKTAEQLCSLLSNLAKAQETGAATVNMASTDPANMLPMLMLTFYNGNIAYRFDAIESSPGNGEFKFKGEIRADNGSLATWVARFFYGGALDKKFEFYLTK